jgi:phage-related holin
MALAMFVSQGAIDDFMFFSVSAAGLLLLFLASCHIGTVHHRWVLKRHPERQGHNAATTIVFSLVAIAIALIIDLDRPRLGFIKIDQDPMERVIRSINPAKEAPDGR